MHPVEQRHHHENVDPHVRGRWLADLVLGAQDGLVNTLGVVLGVAAASSSVKVTLAAGLAAGFAEAVSMAAVAYTTSMARGELFQAELEREHRHVEQTPEIEREEVRTMYASKGFSGELLDRVVDTICANRDVWVGVMMSEEHGLSAVDRGSSLRSAGIVGIASLAGAIVPVVPFALFERKAAVALSLFTGALALFGLGAYKARVTATSMTRGGAVLAVIGIASAIVGYLVGAAFGE